MKTTSMRVAQMAFLAACALLSFQLLSCGRSEGTLQSAVAPQGAWVSSGGELFKYSTNPWFLKNVKVVRYCLQVSESEFSASPRKLDELFQQAVHYWENEFYFYTKVPAPQIQLGIATQTFVKVSCDTEPDLQILAGYRTLSPDKLAYLRTPREFVSVTVRTNYDPISLSGKGFVFLSSDRGPNHMDGAVGTIESAWQYDGLLLRTLVHELGHIFGVPHLSNGVMSAQYPEYILLRSQYANFVRTDDLPPFLFPPRDGYLNCQLSDRARAWFRMPQDLRCLFFKIPYNESYVQKMSEDANIDFYGTNGRGESLRHLGRANWHKGNQFIAELSRAVTLSLPPRQQVFDSRQLSDANRLYLVGAVIVDFRMAMDYRADGSSTPIALSLGAAPSGYELSDIREGENRSLIYYAPSCQEIPNPYVDSIRACLTP